MLHFSIDYKYQLVTPSIILLCVEERLFYDMIDPCPPPAS